MERWCGRADRARADLPIMIGTDGPRLLQLTAQYADMWNTTWTYSVEEVLPRIAALDAACAQAGRDPDTIDRSCCVFIDVEGAKGVYTQYGDGTPIPNRPRKSPSFINELRGRRHRPPDGLAGPLYRRGNRPAGGGSPTALADNVVVYEWTVRTVLDIAVNVRI